jgi:hypothetical protein
VVGSGKGTDSGGHSGVRGRGRALRRGALRAAGANRQ